MKTRSSALVLLACVFWAFEAPAVEDLKTPHEIIAQLRSHIVAIGKSTAKQDDFDTATRAAVDDLNTFIASNRMPEALTTKDSWGKTPLNAAAYMGYSEIVAILLAQPSVKIALNEPDDIGMTPWGYAVFAPRQSAFACNPQIFTSPFSWSSLHMSHPYYAHRNPYAAVKKQLEEAGATIDVETARQQWHDICKNQTSQTRLAVKASNNIQGTVIDEGERTLQTFLDKLQRR